MDVLELAKQKFRLYMATDCGFPERETHLHEASSCLTEALANHSEKGIEFDDGMSLHPQVNVPIH